MNRIIKISLLTFLFMFVVSCEEELDGLRTINSIPLSTEITLDYLPVNIFSIPSPPIGINVRAAIEDEIHTDEVVDNVEEIKLKTMTIDRISCDNRENFDFLKAVKLYAKTDELEEKEIGHINEIPEGVTSFDLITTNEYIDEYIKSTSLKLIIKYESVLDARNLKLDLKMNFKAKIG